MDTTEHRGPSLVAVGSVFASLFIASLAVGTAMAGGEHFPSPFAPETATAAYFPQHAQAVAAAAFLQFGPAIPLLILTPPAPSPPPFLRLPPAGLVIAPL